MWTTAALSALGVALALYVLWVLYLAVMNIKRAQAVGDLPLPVKIAAAPVVVLGFVLDVVLNLTVLSVALLEIPEEGTISQRLRRHNNAGPGDDILSRWRYLVARTVEPFLDPFDPDGDHI